MGINSSNSQISSSIPRRQLTCVYKQMYTNLEFKICKSELSPNVRNSKRAKTIGQDHRDGGTEKFTNRTLYNETETL
jgi:hypothetical protein